MQQNRLCRCAPKTPSCYQALLAGLAVLLSLASFGTEWEIILRMQSALIEKVVCSTPPAVYTSGPEYRPWAWCWTSPKAPKPESRANRRSCARRRSEYASPQADWYRKVGLQELISHLASIPGRRLATRKGFLL